MGRRFTAASSERIYVGTAGLNGFSWTFGTVAAVIRFVSLPAGAGTVIATNEASGASLDLYVSLSGGNFLRYYDGTNDRELIGIATGTTYIVGMTKATGTATARGHLYDVAAKTWTHAAASGTTVNSAANTSLGIGCYADSSSDPLDAEYWALGMWQGLVMTDSEFERLAKGRWLDFAPDFYEQWTDGREDGDMVRTLGRFPVRQTTRTGTTKGVQPKPAGVALDVRRRRR